jgi:geranylgeranyl reductase family protein
MQNSGACDVVVVGAGPAGAATAIRLAAAGLRVVVIDRARFPRDKTCGDFVGPVAIDELRALGLDGAPALARGNPIRDAGLFVDGEHLMTFRLPEVGALPDYGVVVPRVELDAMLANAARSAGAELLEDHTFAGLRTGRDGAEVVVRTPAGERVLRCRLVVGADGSSSHVARAVRGRTPPRDDLIVAVRGYFEGVDGPVGRCDVYFGSDSFPGYAWIFPTAPGVANVGVGMVVETFPPAPERLRELLRRLIANDGGMRARLGAATMRGELEGWPLATFDDEQAPIADRVLLVGDAASLINPINGEGIQYALTSARWAAETAIAALRANDCSRAGLTGYVTRVRRELSMDVAFARLLVRAIANRSLNPLWLFVLRAIVARARADADYARATGGVVAGVVPAHEALAPGMLLRTLAALGSASAAAVAGALREPGSVADAIGVAATAIVDAAHDPAGAAAWRDRLGRALLDFARARRAR